VVGPTAKREAVGWLIAAHDTSLRRACRIVGLSTPTWRYVRRQDAQKAALTACLRRHAAVRVRFGYRRLHVLLAREGWAVNHKRVYRPYRVAGLQVRR
jgi:putative transposase